MNEAGSKEARASVAEVLKKGWSLHTVDIALAEGLNAIWKHANVLKDLKAEEAIPATEDLTKIFDGLNIVSAREVAEETAHIALTHGITVYDSLYIATALKLNGTLYTADRQLCTTAKKITNARLLKTKE